MRSIKNIIHFLLILGFILSIASCEKDKTPEPTPSEFTNGLLVLNEGLFNQNNSTLDWVNLETGEVKNDVFYSINGRLLGDTGNDLLLYGSKIYISITTSSTVEILDKNTLKSKKQLQFNYNNIAQQPRFFAPYKEHVFVSSYDGYVSIIDTTSLAITKRIQVGRNPDGIAISGNSLYVSSSGGLDFGNMDSTVMQIDLTTLEVVDTFVVGTNPGDMVADNYGNIYVVKRGDYGNDPSEIVRINTQTKTVENLEIPATTLTLDNDNLYAVHYEYSTGNSVISYFNCASQTLINPNLINSSEITTVYGLYVLKNGQFLILDAMNFVNSGYLRFFNSSGELVRSINVGLNPNSVIEL